MIYTVYKGSKFLGYVSASNSSEAMSIASRVHGLSGLRVVRERNLELEEMDKDTLCNLLNQQLKVSVNWSRLPKQDLLAISSSVMALLNHIEELRRDSTSVRI